MKILSVAWTIYDERLEEFAADCTGGGAGVVIKNICEYLGRKEESHLFIGKSCFPEITLGHYSIVNTQRSVPLQVQGRLEKMLYIFKKTLNERKPDIVNVHGVGVFAKMCIDEAIKENIPVVYTDHLYVGRTRCFEKYEETFEWDNAILTIPNLNIVAVSNGMRNKILADYPQINPDKVTAIINGTDFTAEYVRSDFREKYELTSYKVLICVGTILDRKNQMQIVRMFPLLPEDLKRKIKIIFCGKDRLGGKLQTAIQENNLSDHLIYAGTFSNNDMKKLYSIADGMIMPSYAEGLSIAELEAITYGIPVIMYGDSECAADLNDEKITCFTKDRSDQALADAVKEWDKKTWNKDDIADFAKRFTMEKTADQYLQYYKKVIREQTEMKMSG